jgi:hypothetical protein
VLRPTSLPWGKPKRELVLLALVALATLSPIYVVSTQDVSRLCLTRALVHAHLTIQPCAGNTIDQASYGGHNYTDKAPGLSLLAVPAAVITRLPTPARWVIEGDFHLWAVRLLVSGAAFLLLVFAVGRISEGISPGNGGVALVTFAVGTLVGPLAATSFGHVLAAALAFGGFALAWSRRFAASGLLAGTAVLTDYTTAVIGVTLAVYVLLAGVRPLLRYAAGAAPPLALLGAYDRAAFGSPFHLSYRYVANTYSSEQQSGFFGIHVPTGHGLHLVLVGDRGLLVASPIVVAAAAGLVLLARSYRREAIVCMVVFLLLLIANCGYFNPYGGISPGPRFLVAGLPFLALGLGPAFERWRRATAALAGISIVAMMTLLVTWSNTENVHYRDTVWGELVRLVDERGSSRLVQLLTKNVAVAGPVSRLYAAGIISVIAIAAFALALRDTRERAALAPSARRPS